MAQGADDLAPDDFVAPVTDDPTQGAPDVNVTVTDDTKAATDDADQVGCFSTINGLALQEAGADTAERRIYQLCPNSVYGIGSLDYDNVLQAGQEPIPIRPNMHIKCGASGVLENSCVLNGGDVQLDGTSFFGVRNSDRIDNVTIEGVTFLDAHMYNVWLNKPGSVKFINCEFRVRFALPPKNAAAATVTGRFRMACKPRFQRPPVPLNNSYFLAPRAGESQGHCSGLSRLLRPGGDERRARGNLPGLYLPRQRVWRAGPHGPGVGRCEPLSDSDRGEQPAGPANHREHRVR
jgi:hypothetical protein